MNKKIVRRILDGAKNLRIVVWGDAMLDVYHHAANVRMCPEAPVPSVELGHTTYALGGAANVAAGIASLGAKAELVACVGAGKDWALMRKMCDFYGVGTRFVHVSKQRKTTTKTRFIRGSHIMFRIDDDCKKPWDASDMLQKAAKRNCCDALVVSDYAKGAVNRDSVFESEGLAYESYYVSPKPTSDLLLPADSVCVCNRKEIAELTCDFYMKEADVSLQAMHFLSTGRLSAVIVTMDSNGAIVAGPRQCPVKLLQTAVAVGNTCGAGDTFLAAFVVAHKVLEDAVSAAEFGNYCAGLAVQHIGTTVVTKDML